MSNNVLLALPWSLDKIGGVNKVVDELAKQFASDSSITAIVMTSDWDSKKPMLIKHQSYTEVKYRIRPFPVDSIKEKIAFYLFLPQFLYDLHKLCKKLQITTVNFHFPNEYLYPFIFLKKLRIIKSLVISFHGADLEQLTTKRTKYTNLFRYYLNSANFITACSSGLAKKICNEMPIKSKPIKVANNGVSYKQELIDSSQFELPRRFILTVGTIEPKKGQDNLITAFKIVEAKSSDLHLLIVGRKTEYYNELAALVKKLNLEDKVTFYFDVPPQKVMYFYEQALMFVSPSRKEPFGIVLLEAAIAKLPVIATNTDGAVEILTSNIDSQIVAVNDVEAMAEAILTNLKDPFTSHQMAERLEQKVKVKFTWENTKKAYQSTYYPYKQ